MNPSVCLTPLIVTPGPAQGVKSLIPASVISTGAARLAPLMITLVMMPFAQTGPGIKVAATTRTSVLTVFIGSYFRLHLRPRLETTACRRDFAGQRAPQ